MSTATANERFWPATFADRGATIPFTTPTLAAARMRAREGEKVEYLVPGLSGSKGTYVIPSKAIPEMFKLTVHDRALLEELDNNEATTPYAINIASLRVARTGLAGAEAAVAAKAILSAAENQELVTRLFVIIRALEQLSSGTGKFAVTDLMSEVGKNRARAELTAAGHKLGIELQPLLDRLEEWGTLVAPLGVAGTVAIGPMRRVWQQLTELSRALREWAEGEWVDDARPDATLVADVAEETNRVASVPLGEIDRELDKIGKALIGWMETQAKLKVAVDRLAWFFDGWDHVLKVWDAAQREPIHRQREALTEMVRLLPLIPQNEVKAAQHTRWQDLTVAMRRQVRALEGWTTGDIDLELMMRLERYKSTIV
jgi:hypothetical protein